MIRDEERIILNTARYILLLLGLLLCDIPLMKSAAAQIFPESYDVIIDVGHGGVDGGTSSNDILEKNLNLAIGKKLFKLLQDESVTVGITRIHDYALSDDSPFQYIQSRHMRDMKQRKLIADSLEPKVFVSLHTNWSSNRNIRGPLVIYQPNNKSYALAHLIQHHLNAFYGVKKAPVKGRPYFLMNHLEMPSIIIEMGYISNPKDIQRLTQESSQDEMAIAIAHAIKEYFLLYPF